MKRLVLSLLISCLPLWFFAQSISVNAEMDSACIWIGEQTKFTLSAIQPKDKQVVFPLFSDSIVNGLEIVDYCKKIPYYFLPVKLKCRNHMWLLLLTLL